MQTRSFSIFDVFLILCVIFLITIGIFFIYSAGVNSSGLLVKKEYIKQIVWASTGILVMLFFAVFDYRFFYNHARKIYAIMIGLLIITLVFGKKVKGARSWLGIGGLGIQSAEFCKILFILFFAYFLDRTSGLPPRKRFLQSVGLLLIPMGLILMQPDLGSASVYIPIFLSMGFIANISLLYLLVFMSAGSLTVIFTVLPIWETEIFQGTLPILQVLTNTNLRLLITVSSAVIMIIALLARIFFRNRYYTWISTIFGIIVFSLVASVAMGKVLKPYQVSRLIVFMDPSVDPRGAGWNIIQSKIAIGSGNLFGQGFLRGPQSHLQFLPEQSTDFIFSILSEELGFAGCCLVFALYFLILMRILYIIRSTTNNYGYYISAGILGMLFFHFIVNVGMVMGIMPITGIPLLFLSYGGSSLWTAMICIGLLISISTRRLDFQELI